jgi:hypothetical protein
LLAKPQSPLSVQYFWIVQVGSSSAATLTTRRVERAGTGTEMGEVKHTYTADQVSTSTTS